MQHLTPDHPDTASQNGVAQNLTRLHDLFPEAFSEGRLNFDVLKQLLGDQIDDQPEKYGLTWNGKARARRHALTPTRATLRPDPASSVDWDTTQNLMIEGDNLEVLKLLQRSYAGKVKLIYIDPPYNTGKDFVYPDDYTDSLKNYQELTGQLEEGRRVSSNTESSGRFHTDWLNMMYPRLKLARELLRDDGAIFVSIADHEIHNLRIIMDDIFGREGFIATIIWHKMDSPKNSAKHFSEDHDYIVVYAKNAEDWHPNGLPRTEEMIARYTNPDNDPRGVWIVGDLAARNYYSAGTYSITTPTGRVISGPPAGSSWRISEEKFRELDKDRRIWWGSDGSSRPGIKRFLSEVKDSVVPQTYWNWKDVGSTRHSKRELSLLMEAEAGEDIFITPKPTKLMQRIIQISTDADSIILDFFAGTGTTGQACLQQNAIDSGKRTAILVQMPEPLGEGEWREATTIAELTKERLRRAGAKVKAENPMFAGDTGFRVFKLDSSNVAAWDGDAARQDVQAALLSAEDNIKAGRTDRDVLYEVLLKLGLPLTTPIEERTIAGLKVQLVGGGALVACLERRIAAAQVQELGQGMADWLTAENPAGEAHLLFLDSAFENDNAKLNLSKYLSQRAEVLGRNWVVRSL
ncbi:site-specific DNA-methyltransferase (plasmid) [Deinococcus sp. VB343]|uniref:site-specific DNA-methyltransferase n=1 Tax=Deinococcus sp. VB343 TaxID=3385567 RepID=UPI0039C923AA